jgi:hypothetical protein
LNMPRASIGCFESRAEDYSLFVLQMLKYSYRAR